ncbi:hypothetical protein FF80_02682 [Devosia sp. LC5]|uniref:DUF3995 domain-containing protein n=1 Tax=Devosia sp. LC5 TaxID=1502724 RepID=UPI0004E35723|nr:DUF3995 domain-containing protein [Devosia sp. LC5]KFC66419.1 hypothetical protein FF80_02682 [Devosia sp. LC5]
MSMLISAFMFIALLAVSFAHLLWSFGRTWPIRDEKLLAQTVVGFRDIERMPPRLASFAVAVATLAAGILALALADHDSGGLALTLLGIPAAAVFLARGAIGYTPWWAAQTPEPNFRLNDSRVYSPLCLLLGAGFVALTIMRLL